MNTNDNINNETNNNTGEFKSRKTKKGIASFIPYLFVVAIIVVICMLIFPNFFFGDGKDNNPTDNTTPSEPTKPTEPEKPKTSLFKIFDTTSNARPYAIVVNNTPVAVKVQEGLNKAYIVYELPTEFHTSRLLAVFKDVKDLTVGTIRSCRHNFTDYSTESDAILVCFGWSHYARDEFPKEAKAGNFEYLNGNESIWASAFWRDNPEKLAREHTAYTSLKKLDNFTTNVQKYRKTSDKSLLLNYSATEIDLGTIEGNKPATSVSLPYGSVTTKFTYDANTKMYTRVVNGKVAKDHKTKEPFTTKNIIIVKINHSVMPDNYYWDLKTTGSGKGYYITNGKYVPITWKKDSKYAKSKYYYSNGKEIEVNDGRTYIEVHTTSKSASIK